MSIPNYPPPGQSDFVRWGKVVKRFGYSSVITKPSPENGQSGGLMIKNSDEDNNQIGWVDDFESWNAFTTSNLMAQQPTWSNFFDQFPPHKAEFIERKIHPWIKMYREPD